MADFLEDVVVGNRVESEMADVGKVFHAPTQRGLFLVGEVEHLAAVALETDTLETVVHVETGDEAEEVETVDAIKAEIIRN